jgi:putative transcriptional regulator
MEVKIARIKKGYTQQQLRMLLGISPQTLVAIERGHYEKVSITLAKKLSEILETPVQELFFQE